MLHLHVLDADVDVFMGNLPMPTISTAGAFSVYDDAVSVLLEGLSSRVRSPITDTFVLHKPK